MSEQRIPNIQEVWESVVNEIEMSISRPNFATWFKNIHLHKEEDGVIYLGVPSEFVRNWIRDKHHKMILRLFREASEQARNVEYVIIDHGKRKQAQQAASFTPQQSRNELPLNDLYINKEDNLNPKYTFDSFIVGPFNELAYTAAQAIMKGLGVTYNPFFVYGGTGLGKTHLLQAVGNAVKQHDSSKKVFYMSSEKFFLEYTNAVGANRIGEFKDRYRKYDVFIMDDIQFLAKKRATQDELFHVFNTLYDQNKQIIFSSDKHYNYIPDLEDRLRSRFGAGMIVDIAEPDFESRMAIIKAKARMLSFQPSDSVLEYLAGTLEGSIREIEGTLNMIACQAQLKNNELDQQDIKKLLKNTERPKKTVSTDDVVRIVSEFYNIERDFIHQKTRRKEIVKPRQIVMFLLREDFQVSYPTIGQKLGGRDHTTVIHSCEKVREDIKNNQNLSQEIEQIRAML